MTTALALVDRALPGPALVAGTLPPAGRDLDLLVAPDAVPAVAHALEQAGFVRRGSTWARFDPLELVDLEPAAGPDLADLLERSEPLEGCRRVRTPDPADALRLTARDHAADGRLTAGRRARAGVGPDVWAEARRRGDAEALDLLEAALAGTPPRRLVGRASRRVARVRGAGVIAVSGVDGAGKSTQAGLLRDTLEAAGFDVAVEWNRLSHDAVLTLLAAPVKRLLGRSDPEAEPSTKRSGPTTGPAGRGRGRRARRVRDGQAAGGAVGQAWVVVVALANAWAHLRSVRRHTLAGRVVLCDRYVLDSLVHLDAHYPPGPGRRLAARLVRLLSPRPRAAFYLAVPAEVALARNSDPSTDDRVATQVSAYDAQCSRAGALRLDATAPPERLAAEIARESWRRL